MGVETDVVTGRRTVLGSAISLLFVITSLALGPATPVSATEETAVPPSSCPELTDSIRRLYLAYFNREPDADGFTGWVEKYQSGEADLPTISEELAISDEFAVRYGSLSDDRFVELVYRNVLRRSPEENGRDHWVSALSAGYPRGLLMLAFSESEEFVRRTDTARPLAGFLTWYPEGVHWYCGAGSAPQIEITPLAGERISADFMFHNNGDSTSEVELHTMTDGQRQVAMAEATMPPGVTLYRWDGLFSGDDAYGNGLEIQAGPSTGWAVVFYPRSIGPQRLGWQITN